MEIDKNTGLIDVAEHCPSPNFDERPEGCSPEAIIVHCISLPPGQYGGSYVEQFFCNTLCADDDRYFAEISHLTVSAHFYIKRNGELVQFVDANKRAWHAGESACMGRPAVNNFSIGVELEGLDTDESGFTSEQYDCLRCLVDCLQQAYPSIDKHNIYAHSDIAPGRKMDPGPYFDWHRLFS